MLYIVWFYLCEMSRIGKFIETESRLMVTRDWDSRECGMSTMSTVSFWNDKNAQLLAMMNAQSNEYAKATELWALK